MIEFAQWLQATSLSVAIQSTSWVIPLLQSIHILMIGIVFVAIAVVALRVLGLARTEQPLEAVWSRFAVWLWAALVTMAATGLLLIVAEPVREFTSTSFWLKMMLIVVAVVSAATFARSVRTGVAASAAGETPSGGLKAAAVATVCVWVAIIFLGRFIAYDIEVWGALSLAAQG